MPTVLHETWQASTVPAGRWSGTSVGDSTIACSNGLLRVATGTSAFNSSSAELLGRTLPVNFTFETTCVMPASLAGSGWMMSFRGEGAKSTWTIDGCYQLRWSTDNFFVLLAIAYGGAETNLGAAVVTGSAGATFGVKVSMIGAHLRAWMWNKTGAEPMVPTLEIFNARHRGGKFILSSYTTDTTSENWDFGPMKFSRAGAVT